MNGAKERCEDSSKAFVNLADTNGMYLKTSTYSKKCMGFGTAEENIGTSERKSQKYLSCKFLSSRTIHHKRWKIRTFLDTTN